MHVQCTLEDPTKYMRHPHTHSSQARPERCTRIDYTIYTTIFMYMYFGVRCSSMCRGTSGERLGCVVVVIFVVRRKKNLIKTFTWYYDYVSMVRNYLKHEAFFRHGTANCVQASLQNGISVSRFTLSLSIRISEQKEESGFFSAPKINTKDGIVNKQQIKVFVQDFYL